jgi:predicted O-methyltransferase YrrM|tara:strand:- start:287 stop:1030 length:744 start_codon:yes stop_codon:yes gene_type:complete
LNFFSLFKRNLIYSFKKKISIDDDNININSLDGLFYHYGSDKSDIFKKTENKGHGYSKFYKQKLEKLRNKKINILEVGSYAGASAAAFVKYLPESNIFCFDVNISNFEYKSKKIHVFGLDINNQKKTIKTVNQITDHYNIKEFDIIIDDGSHNLSDILMGFKFFFKYLKSKGLYIIEDFKHPNYYRHNNNINHILIDELFKNLENKNTFNSDLFTKNEQLDFMNMIDKIEVYKGNLNDSDIGFITKC